MIPYYEKGAKKARVASLLVLVLLVIACTKTIRSTITINGSMNILGPVPEIWENQFSVGWYTQGSPAPGQLSIVELSGIPALKVVNAPASLITVKPVQASLLATPYLSWAWNMESQDNGQHPVSLFVGLQHNNQQTRNLAPSFIRSGEALPYHDRMLSLTWGDSALQRGTITTINSSKNRKKIAGFTVRGGQENSGSWWFETVDLYDIYRRAWPNDNIEKTQLTFIGIGTAPGNTPIAGYISGLRLSR